MSKVYLVTWSDYENDTIYGIFSTRAAAEALVAEAVRHDPEHGKELDIDEEELDVPLEERGAQDVTFSSDGSAYWVPPFQWSTTASEVHAPSFYDVLGGMWCDRVVAQRLTVEVHAHSHDEGVAKATLLAGEIKAAVPWGDNDALAKWWQARQAGEERKCQQ